MMMSTIVRYKPLEGNRVAMIVTSMDRDTNTQYTFQVYRIYDKGETWLAKEITGSKKLVYLEFEREA